MSSGVPDFRKDTEQDIVARIVPRVMVSLLGLLLVATAWLFSLQVYALYNALIMGFVLFFVGVRGFWLPYVRAVQLGIAAWLPLSCLVFHVRGGTMWSWLGVAGALALITLRERPVHA